MTTTTIPDVPIPASARPDAWQDDAPQPYQVLLGEVRGFDGVDINRVSFQPTAVQFSDGRVDDGSVHEPPHVLPGRRRPQLRAGPRSGRRTDRGSRRS